ncbi:hypothetical protein RIF29_16524 [Crotalaria pallida]|uniref:Uncharacterized protein n=1 Tax=Crotalaria pallida TaxID=3830 RepID=A0AAN9IC50_CROPI
MAKPTPVRPWSRFASLRPVIPPPQSQPLEPNANNAAPIIVTSAPSSPPQKPPSSVPSSSTSLKPLITSSVVKPSSTIKSPPTKTPIVQSQKQSPPPPPPLALQPSKEKDVHKKVLDSEDYDMIRAITIAGENKGAYMKIIQYSSNKPKYLNKKGNPKEYESEDSDNANRKDKSQKGRRLFPPSMAAYVNSNVQCVNNSLLCHSTCSINDPGVHLTLSKKGFGLKEPVNGKNN